MAANTTNFDLVQKLYIAYYQRPADPDGLVYWASRVTNEGRDAVINAFATSAESSSLYGSITSSNIVNVVNQIYQALFNRDAELATTTSSANGTVAGENYYVTQFKAGNMTAGTIALRVFDGVIGTDKAVLDQKVVYANEFTAQVDGRPFTDTNFGLLTTPNAITYTGDTDAVAARGNLKAVNANTAVTNASVSADLQRNIADAGDATFKLAGTVLDAPAAAPQIRATLDSAKVGDGDPNNGGSTGAVAFQQENSAGALVGAVLNGSDEGTAYTAKNGQTFDVRDLVTGAQRGDAFTTVNLGTNGADTLTATSANTYINGGAGNDTITGGTGKDFLVGGDGDDQISAGTGDSVIGGAGTDTVVLAGNRADYAVADTTASMTLTKGSDVITLVKTAGVNTVENVRFADGTVATNQLLNPVYTLSTGLDKGSAFTGTAGNDSFNADILTLNNGDELNGGGGNDTLNATINQDTDATLRLTSIETLNLTALGARTLDAFNFIGVTAINTVNSAGKITVNNLADANAALGYTGTNINDIATTYVAGALAGTADKLVLNLTGASNVKATATPDGAEAIESVEINATGTSSVATLNTGATPTATVKGSGTLALAAGTLDGKTTVAANAFTGDLTISGLTGNANGTSLQLGNGNNNVTFASSAALTAGKSNTIQAGSGNNVLDVTPSGAVGKATYVVTSTGSDRVKIRTTNAKSWTSDDLLSLGGGNDTLVISGDGTNSLVLLGVENLILDNTATGINTIVTADTALKVTAQAGNGTATAVDVRGLVAGSTFTTENASGQTAGNSIVNVAFKNAEAASTLTMGAKVSDAMSTTNITAVTMNTADTVATSGLTTTGATSMVVNADKAFDISTGGIGAADGKLQTVTVTGKDAVAIGNVQNTAALTSVTVSGAKATSVGTIDSSKLSTVSVTSTGGAAAVGNISATAALTSAVNVTVSGATTATLGTVNAAVAGLLGLVNVTASNGLLTAGAIKATTQGALTYTATTDAIKSGDIAAANAAGTTVNFTAAKAIDNGSGAKFTVSNTAGSITATVAGTTSDAATANGVKIDFTAGGTAGVVNLTASNTGGLKSTITESGTAGAGQSTTITVGNAAAGKSNDLTIKGTVDTLNITGGSGADNINFDSTNKVKTGIISLGGGTDSIDFSNLAGANGSIGTSKGVIVNLGNTVANFDAGTANASSAIAFSVGEFDAAGAKKVITSNFSLGLGGVESVKGTVNADYFVAATTGSTFNGSGGADTFVLGAGNDVLVYSSTSDSPGTVAANLITSFDYVLNFVTGQDKFSIDKVNSTDFTSATTTTVTALSISNVADFSALNAALKAANANADIAASSVAVAQVFDVTLTGTGLAASGITHLIIVNDGTAGYTADDLVIELAGTSSNALVQGDFQYL